jgi:hypothetical protein
MEEFLRAVIDVCLYIVCILLIPVIVLLATPVILLWPATKGSGG